MRTTGRLWSKCSGRGGLQEGSGEDNQVRTTGRLWSKCSGRGGLQEGSSLYVQVEEDYRKDLVNTFR